jgi:hypothetical protein
MKQKVFPTERSAPNTMEYFSHPKMNRNIRTQKFGNTGSRYRSIMGVGLQIGSNTMFDKACYSYTGRTPSITI